jgi:hypothetical protein
MKSNQTFIFRVALPASPPIYRDIEIEASKSLYDLARAITAAFDFNFDHAFGFYTGLTPAEMWDAEPRYELFADMGESDSGARGVKETSVSQAFSHVGHALLFLFDYGDEWHFRVELTGAGVKLARTRYPRVVATKGEAPPQYEDYDEDEGDEQP